MIPLSRHEHCFSIEICFLEIEEGLVLHQEKLFTLWLIVILVDTAEVQLCISQDRLSAMLIAYAMISCQVVSERVIIVVRLMMQAHNTGKSGMGKFLGKMRKGTVPQLSCSSPQAQAQTGTLSR